MSSSSSLTVRGLKRSREETSFSSTEVQIDLCIHQKQLDTLLSLNDGDSPGKASVSIAWENMKRQCQQFSQQLDTFLSSTYHLTNAERTGLTEMLASHPSGIVGFRRRISEAPLHSEILSFSQRLQTDLDALLTRLHSLTPETVRRELLHHKSGEAEEKGGHGGDISPISRLAFVTPVGPLCGEGIALRDLIRGRPHHRYLPTEPDMSQFDENGNDTGFTSLNVAEFAREMRSITGEALLELLGEKHVVSRCMYATGISNPTTLQEIVSTLHTLQTIQEKQPRLKRMVVVWMQTILYGFRVESLEKELNGSNLDHVRDGAPLLTYNFSIPYLLARSILESYQPSGEYSDLIRTDLGPQVARMASSHDPGLGQLIQVLGQNSPHFSFLVTRLLLSYVEAEDSIDERTKRSASIELAAIAKKYEDERDQYRVVLQEVSGLPDVIGRMVVGY